jgi:hypothetical protein
VGDATEVVEAASCSCRETDGDCYQELYDLNADDEITVIDSMQLAVDRGANEASLATREDQPHRVGRVFASVPSAVLESAPFWSATLVSFEYLQRPS